MVDNDQPDIDKAVCDADTGAWNTANNSLHMESYHLLPA